MPVNAGTRRRIAAANRPGGGRGENGESDRQPNRKAAAPFDSPHQATPPSADNATTVPLVVTTLVTDTCGQPITANPVAR
jgi:hypothetical protein